MKEWFKGCYTLFLLAGAIFCIFYILTLAGCASRVVYKDVFVPVKCDIARKLN